MRTKLAADVHAPAAARRFVRRQLQEVLDGPQRPVREDVELIVSELVTNSVRAGASVVDLELRVDPHRVDVAITDDAAGWPTPRPPSLDGVNGRGLAIVDRLADDWRTVARPRGKSVIVTRRRQVS